MPSQPSEPIVVQTNSFGAPSRFFWRGRAYPIESIVRIWRAGHGQRRGQRIYQVRSHRRTFWLHFDQRWRRWTLVRAPWRTRLGLAMERLAARLGQ